MTLTLTTQIEGALEIILRPPPPSPSGWVEVTAWFGAFSVTSEGNSVAYTLPSGMQVQVQVAYVDAHGNPATVDGEVAWSSSDDNTVTAVADASDSTLCLISAPGPVGNAQVTATADADLGAGVTTLTTLLDVTVAAGEAVSGTIAPTGAATPIP